MGHPALGIGLYDPLECSARLFVLHVVKKGQGMIEFLGRAGGIEVDGTQHGLLVAGFLPLSWTGTGRQDTDNNSPSPKRVPESKREYCSVRHIHPPLDALEKVSYFYQRMSPTTTRTEIRSGECTGIEDEHNLADFIVTDFKELCHQGGYARLGESINETGRRAVFKGTDDLVGEPSRRVGLQGVDVILCRVKFVKRTSESEVLREQVTQLLDLFPGEEDLHIL
jgi:hypothetical protein